MSEELDLYQAGELDASEQLLVALADELGTDRDQAAEALASAAQALTRASLLAAADLDGHEDDDEDDGR